MIISEEKTRFDYSSKTLVCLTYGERCDCIGDGNENHYRK